MLHIILIIVVSFIGSLGGRFLFGEAWHSGTYYIGLAVAYINSVIIFNWINEDRRNR